MCSVCEIPELIPVMEKKSKKKKILKLKCSACGNLMEPKNDKISLKISEHIMKCLDRNEWKIRKGVIVNEEEDETIDLFSL